MDRHSIKMILEYAQLLSTAHRVLDGNPITGLSKSGRKQQQYILPDSRNSIMYSGTHVNHPSAIWVRQSYANYVWLSKLLTELCGEYTYRYGKVHKVERDGLEEELMYPPNNIPLFDQGSNLKKFTEPTPAMPDEVKVLREVATDRYEIDSISSYHNYYINNKSHIAKWTKRQMPVWYSEGIKSAVI